MTGMRRTGTVAVALAVLLAAAPIVDAQITTGSVAGTIKDAQGGVIPGATVTLISDTRGTKSTPAVTNPTGDFVFPNVAGDTYTIQVEIESFKMLRRSGIAVSPGSRVSVGTLSIEVGGTSEVVLVRAEAPLIQSTTGERSFTIATESVASLPIANRSFSALAALTPGVVIGSNNLPTRLGGGGETNFMMDGISAMDDGSNRLLIQMNVESIAEVKVLTSTYQAEYGRSSGLQVTAVTKSGTNRIRGAMYDVERNSDWNANSKTNKLNGDPRSVSKQRDWGYSIGGPIGKPGGNNKLFFFYAQEFEPRSQGNNVVRFRMPTALERQGDFSQTTDNNSNLYPYIKDPQLTGTCSATSQAVCFADGGVLGRIPTSRLYQTGLNILKMYPEPNLPTLPGGNNYNYQITRPTEKLLGWQPAVRIDYQPLPSLRATAKYTGWGQQNKTINGNIPGWNDTKMYAPTVYTWATSVNYNLSPTMFLEGTYGRSLNQQTGCSLGLAGGPSYCTSALPMNPNANLNNVGLGGLPFLFPDATIMDPRYYQYQALNDVQPPIWDGTRLLKVPAFTWGGRVTNSPPSVPYPGILNTSRTWDISTSLTKLRGRHTIKTGFYHTYALKAEPDGASTSAAFGTVTFTNDTSNPLDSSFPFANAALGIFNSYNQASKFVEGNYVYTNTEAYIQDNWKLTSGLTLDYGLRLAHQEALRETFEQASNFLPEKWTLSAAPVLYVAGCANGVYPCTGTNRQAMNPATGQFLGPNSTLAIGALVPNSGNLTNGLFRPGQGGLGKTVYSYPALGVAPRLGIAYDLTGQQRVVARGGLGLFHDRHSITTFETGENPPTSRNITVRYGQLQTLGTAGLTTEGPPALSAVKRDSKLPSSTQWNAGVQMALPWAVALDLSYVGQHSFNTNQGINLNAVDFGTAFLTAFQDRTQTASATPGATAVSTDLMRSMPGYGTITQQWDRGWRTYHSLQLSFQRRFRDGVSFGFNDTIALSDTQNVNARLQHNPDGTYFIRDDQAQADRLLGDNTPQTHTMKANFVWDLPDLRSSGSALKAVALIVNDWQLSGIWTGQTGTPYTVAFSYQSGGSSVNLTGSPNYGARIRILGDPGNGCSSDVYRQFNTTAFQGPLVGSVGLESGVGYLTGCFSSVLDLSIARNIRLGGGRALQLRADMFNAPNQSGITGRNASITLPSPNDPVTPQNLPFDANGNLLPNRVRPNQAGFGAVNGYQAARTVQFQARFSF
jgi:hypothetical protein